MRARGARLLAQAHTCATHAHTLLLCISCYATRARCLPRAAQPGAEMCGTLKNIVALGCGILDGMGMGSNSKGVVMRQGLAEMRKWVAGRKSILG